MLTYSTRVVVLAGTNCDASSHNVLQRNHRIHATYTAVITTETKVIWQMAESLCDGKSTLRLVCIHQVTAYD